MDAHIHTNLHGFGVSGLYQRKDNMTVWAQMPTSGNGYSLDIALDYFLLAMQNKYLTLDGFRGTVSKTRLIEAGLK